jgi:hypothetical protein
MPITIVPGRRCPLVAHFRIDATAGPEQLGVPVYRGVDPMIGLQKWATKTVRGSARQARLDLAASVEEFGGSAARPCHLDRRSDLVSLAPMSAVLTTGFP